MRPRGSSWRGPPVRPRSSRSGPAPIPDETAGEAATRILGLLTALSAHDRRTRGHSERVRVFTDVLAAELHLPDGARDRLRWAALLHDLGKVRVPAECSTSRQLSKPTSGR